MTRASRESCRSRRWHPSHRSRRHISGLFTSLGPGGFGWWRIPCCDVTGPTGPGGAYRSRDDRSPFDLTALDNLADDLDYG